MKIPGWNKYPRRESSGYITTVDMKKQMFSPPLRDEFTKFGDKFEKIAFYMANGFDAGRFRV